MSEYRNDRIMARRDRGHESMASISHHWLGHFLCGSADYRILEFHSIGVNHCFRRRVSIE